MSHEIKQHMHKITDISQLLQGASRTDQPSLHFLVLAGFSYIAVLITKVNEDKAPKPS